MRTGTKTQADHKPQQLNIRHLYGDIYELAIAENVETIKITPKRGESTEARTAFTYTEYRATRQLSGYEEAVAALIELKYTHGDEISLMRKGIADANNAEYLEYLKHVDACKTYAREVFKNE